ncbi:hypothetical protein [uncultured Bilophila sp.]|uniref:hypothetical protein n=1 Tax=uncultured Bilophila sp. TaxID=529385 RepID=UPI00261B028F|nr:hypothetical protein [uncultured Bilophila sp.]
MPESADFTWKFHRIGGLDQVTLRTPEELTHLEELDPKLWVALSCPANELQFDDRTLQLIDTNNDGRIRISEVREAVRWAVERLKDPASLADGRPDLPLSEIRQDTDDNPPPLRRRPAHPQGAGARGGGGSHAGKRGEGHGSREKIGVQRRRCHDTRSRFRS